MNKLNKLRSFFLAALSGALLVLAFPGYNQLYLAWVAFVPLFFVIQKESPKASFFYGCLTGFVMFIWGLHWTTFSMMHFGGMPYSLAFLSHFVFTIYSCIMYGLFSYMSKKLMNKGVSAALFFPFSYMVVAFWYPTLFPFTIANTQIDNFYFAQFADIVGAVALSVIVLYGNYIIYIIVQSALRKDFKSLSKPIAIFALVLIVVYSYGFLRVKQIRNMDTKQKITVAVLQGNLGIDMLGSADFDRKSMRVFREMTLAKKDNDLIVWPESSVPLSYTKHVSYKRAMDQLVKEVNSEIIFGSWDVRIEDSKRVGYSTAFLIGPNQPYQVFDKIKLLPFGDYMPLDDVFPILRTFVIGVGNFKPGKAPKVLTMKNGVKLAPSICYEILIPDLNREMKNLGAQIIVNMTNDAWFGPTTEPLIHLALGRFRTIELRLPLVRSTNTGISAFVALTGENIMSIPLDRRASITREIGLKDVKSVYATVGNLFLYLYLAVTAIMMFLQYRKNSDNG